MHNNDDCPYAGEWEHLVAENKRQAVEIARLQASDRRWQEVQYIHTDRINELSALVAHLRAVEAAAREWKAEREHESVSIGSANPSYHRAERRLLAALASPAAAVDAERVQ